MTPSTARCALVLMTAVSRRDDEIAWAIFDEIGHDVPALRRLAVELARFASEYAADHHGEDLARCLAASIADAAAEEVGCVPMGGP
jgi:hypothetical protein